jgi:hypothetical protein
LKAKIYDPIMVHLVFARGEYSRQELETRIVPLVSEQANRLDCAMVVAFLDAPHGPVIRVEFGESGDDVRNADAFIEAVEPLFEKPPAPVPQEAAPFDPVAEQALLEWDLRERGLSR